MPRRPPTTLFRPHNGHEIVIADVADVAGAYGDQGLRPTRSGDELDFDRVRGVDVDDRTQIAAL
jgi:hypothetical protein